MYMLQEKYNNFKKIFASHGKSPEFFADSAASRRRIARDISATLRDFLASGFCLGSRPSAPRSHYYCRSQFIYNRRG